MMIKKHRLTKLIAVVVFNTGIGLSSVQAYDCVLDTDGVGSNSGVKTENSQLRSELDDLKAIIGQLVNH